MQHRCLLAVVTALAGWTPPFANETLAGDELMAAAIMRHDPSVPADAAAVVEFWRGAGPQAWFAKSDAFDKQFRETFASQYEAAAGGRLKDWLKTPDGALALVILLDQYPRNSFRGTPRMYATDPLARETAAAAIAAGHDRAVPDALAVFFYLPYGHSENLADQDKAVALCERLGGDNLKHAEGHRDIVRRFGRFPHRNAILGRTTTTEEKRFLEDGGYSG